MAARLGADTIAVTSASETAAQYLRQLSWQLEGTGIELLVAPGLIEVAGPRLHIRPFEGLPLLSVEQPRFEGWRRMVKGGVDRSVAAAGAAACSPRCCSASRSPCGWPAPARCCTARSASGINGRSFTMLKFRSMVVDADQQVDAVRDATTSPTGCCSRCARTRGSRRSGRWLRRLSLDELPQLLNVLGGSMSLVGPRPPLPARSPATTPR